MPDLWLATSPGVGVFHDETAVVAAFSTHGIDAAYANWQDIVPDGTPIAVRTTWDYTEHRATFFAWLDAIEATGTRCWNTPARMRWNMDKRYLIELGAAGHPVVPTELVDDFSEAVVRTAAAAQGWGTVVAKPVIGAGAEGLVIVPPDGPMRTFNSAGLTWMRKPPQTPEGACLVQPLMDDIKAGEWSLFYFGGKYSHAILKRPKDGDIRVQEEHGGITVGADPPAVARAAAKAIMADVPDALYARVDGIVSEGAFLLMELELIEPELYFRYAPGSVARFVDAIAGALA